MMMYPPPSGNALGLPEDAESQSAHVHIEADLQRHPALAPLWAASGECVGYQLPDGRQLKPWIVWTLSDPTLDDERDLTGKEAYQFGIEMVDYTTHQVADSAEEDE